MQYKNNQRTSNIFFLVWSLQNHLCIWILTSHILSASVLSGHHVGWYRSRLTDSWSICWHSASQNSGFGMTSIDLSEVKAIFPHFSSQKHQRHSICHPFFLELLPLIFLFFCSCWGQLWMRPSPSALPSSSSPLWAYGCLPYWAFLLIQCKNRRKNNK